MTLTVYATSGRWHRGIWWHQDRRVGLPLPWHQVARGGTRWHVVFYLTNGPGAQGSRPVADGRVLDYSKVSLGAEGI